jgi:lysophospholipase L1-like esterase
MGKSRARRTLQMAALGAAVGALALGPAFAAGAAPADVTPSPADALQGGAAVTYLALGTSLSRGEQPGRGHAHEGFVDVLWSSVRQQIPALRLRNVSCRGETSLSMLTGKRSECHYPAGSQLDAAVAFLESHPGQVAFITLEVGGNDLVVRCFDDHTGLISRACAVDQRPRLKKRLTHIVDALSAAAGPAVPIVAMTYYDPFLGLWGLIPGGRAVARADQRVWKLLNAEFTTAYGAAGVTVADVAATFRIDNFTDTAVVHGRGRLPVNVALTCRWTWFCSPRSFANPHPNRTGYKKIARTYERQLQGLLP